MHAARRLWLVLEPVHAVTYFCPERGEAAEAIGLRGFWRSYFAFRAAPLGVTTAGVVTATFGNFAAAMVERAIPSVWNLVTPAAAVDARARAAAASLRRLAPRIVESAAEEAVGPLRSALAQLPPIGRGLFAANVAVHADDPVAALWQCCTSAREHRGDGHVAALVSHGIDGCEAHVLAAAVSGTDPALLRDNRGWTTEEWSAAEDRLEVRGLLDDAAAATTAGRAAHRAVEDLTDELAVPLLTSLGGFAGRLEALLGPVADAVAASGEVPFPNPMGLPRR